MRTLYQTGAGASVNGGANIRNNIMGCPGGGYYQARNPAALLPDSSPPYKQPSPERIGAGTNPLRLKRAPPR